MVNPYLPIMPPVLEVYLGALGRRCEMLESGYTNICHLKHCF